ncbi:tetratricopeptide repeat protein [bacterium]|nr:tetratricopeptide repeat protein [bacterium]
MSDALDNDDLDIPLPDSSPCLQGERVAFTGTLASMTHAQAHDLTAEHGGEAVAHVSRHTTMLVVGEEGWPLEDDGQASIKLQQAVEQINQGTPLRILRESEWLQLLGLEQRDRDVQRVFTPAMLQQKLGIPVTLVRRWERLGLIQPVQRVFRLPYFDFQEVAGVRRLQEMLTSGIPRDRIEASLSSLLDHFPSIDRPLAQLEILSRDSRVLYRDAAGLVEARTGQRLFDFDSGNSVRCDTLARLSESEPVKGESVAAYELSSGEVTGADERPDTIRMPQISLADPDRWTAEDWFDQGCRQLVDGDAVSAIESLRMAAVECPDDPEIHFYLASALFQTGNSAGALERYHMAVELDHEYIEAWTQLGCVRHLQGDLDGALAAFDIALTSHTDFAEAIYHKSQVLAEAGRLAEAVALWQRYLDLNSAGPWADDVRTQLAEHAEMTAAQS